MIFVGYTTVLKSVYSMYLFLVLEYVNVVTEYTSAVSGLLTENEKAILFEL